MIRRRCPRSRGGARMLDDMKKLLVLLVVLALTAIAAKKVRSA
ncbi:MAG: hypothetical protein ACKVWR_02635 [Acidimicrobiales bacterium]